LGVFFARVVRAGQPAKGARWAMQSIVAGIAAFTPWRSQNPHQRIL
jgi:hypothetical protein